MKKNVSEESANLILGETSEGDVFYVKWLWFTIKLSIPFLDGNTIVKVSKYVSRIERPDVDGAMFPEMMRIAKKAINNECKAIAVATRSKLPFLWKLIGRGEPKDINRLLQIVEDKSDPEAFFLGIGLARGLDKLKPRENSEVEKHSLDGQELSKKP